MRGVMDEAFLQRHPPAKQGTSWVSGACLPRGLTMSNVGAALTVVDIH